MRSFIFSLLLSVSTVCVAWPTQTITVVVPYPPGGINDQLARLFQPDLESIFRVPVQIKNLPGAGNSAAINYMMSQNDNHTFMITMDDLISGPLAQRAQHYNNFKILTIIGQAPYMVFGSSTASIDNFKNQIKQHKTVNMANNGLNGGTYLWTTGLRSALVINPIPYKGGGPLMLDVIAGHTDYGVISLPAVHTQLQKGSAVPIMVSTRTRHPLYPSVPTYTELGFRGPDTVTWFGVFTRNDTSALASQQFSDAVRLIVSNNTGIQELSAGGLSLVNLPTRSAEQFFIRQIRQFEQQRP
jgi:tripartite-type tricarboxylate transporter receptor subunit TctC